LTQALGNLLTNAVKYTGPRGRVWLSAERVGEEVVVRVRDDGIGITSDMLPQIFGLFVQADQALTRSQGGMGIGLALVRKVVEVHGGSVEARSEGPGQGSEFIVRLPVLTKTRQQQPSGGETDSNAKSPIRSLRVLVVDDNQDVAESLAILLRLDGHDVRVAYDSRVALELACDYRPDVAFLDIGMPGMDGYELCRRIRREAALDQVFLVALSGWGQEEDRQRSVEAGFDRHLVKPADPTSVKRVLTHPRIVGDEMERPAVAAE
jgi:CheY-like chemotaxis protein